ncbi:MAG TPA: methyltransferase domain-containing protein [Clostridia bacterium]|nr:methyltransferase domain-containing protein [Clostridia bacterium]
MKKFEVIKSYYEENMAKGLPEYGILGWESEKAQQLRFDAMLAKVDLNGKKLLDVGCGTGNLLEYIRSKGIKIDYTGVDILDQMIDIARSKKLGAEFVKADIFKENIFGDSSFDVIYTSGIFNLNLGNNSEFLKNALDLFFRLSRETVVFNLLHTASPDREDKYFYFHPEEVRELLAGYSHRIEKVEFVEAYLKNDFTVVCSLR